MASATLIVVLSFACATLIAFALLDWLLSEERQVKRVLSNLSAYEATQASEAEPALQPFRTRVLMPIWHQVARSTRAVWPADYRQHLRRRIQGAGHPAGLDENSFLALKAMTPLAAAVALVPAAVFLYITDNRVIALCAVALIPASFWLPDAWLSTRVTSRASKIRRALPDMLDMLTISVEAGLGFDAALAKLVENTSGPLTEEFGIMLREMRAGLARKEALRNLAERAQVSELGAFITAVTQADVFGVSVSSVLRSQAGDMRVRRRQHAEEQAQKATVKLVFPVVVCILPATMLVVVGPAILSIGKAFGLM